jgi:hypothetical protein
VGVAKSSLASTPSLNHRFARQERPTIRGAHRDPDCRRLEVSPQAEPLQDIARSAIMCGHWAGRSRPRRSPGFWRNAGGQVGGQPVDHIDGYSASSGLIVGNET